MSFLMIYPSTRSLQCTGKKIFRNGTDTQTTGRHGNLETGQFSENRDAKNLEIHFQYKRY